MLEAEREWVCPDNFPDLSGYKYIAIDLETYDPDLKEKRNQVHYDIMVLL